MDINVLYDIMISNNLVDINKHAPDRTGRHAFTVAQYRVSYWATNISSLSENMLAIYAAYSDFKHWIADSLSNYAWLTAETQSEQNHSSDCKILLLMHCDDDNDAVLARLTYGTLPPIIQL